MLKISATHAIQRIETADELYEVLMLTTQDSVFEVIHEKHEGFDESFMVVEYEFKKDWSMANQSRSLQNIKQAELFTTPHEAKLRVMDLVLQAKLTA